MIQKIILHNFQAHKHKEIELDAHVNVITGTSDSGKSAVLRGLNWVVNNRPSADAFVSHWARNEKGKQVEDTYVTLLLETGDTVTRLRNAKENVYFINDVKFETVGTDVPEKVQKLLNFSEVNISRQMDAPFLLSETSGEVARFFNKIVHFDVIDEYLSWIKAEKRGTTKSIKTVKETLAEQKKQLEKFTWVEKAIALNTQLESVETQTLTKARLLQEAVNALESFRKNTKVVNDAERILNAATAILERLVTLRNDRTTKESTYTQLQKSISSYKLSTKTIDACIEILPVAESCMKKLSDIRTEVGAKTKQYNALNTSIKEFKSTEKILNQASCVEYGVKLIEKIKKTQQYKKETMQQNKKIQETITAYTTSLQEINSSDSSIKKCKEQLPSVCPLCGGAL